MEYDTIITVRLDTDLAQRWADFKERFNVNTSDFVRTAMDERMAKWPQMTAASTPESAKSA